MSNNNNSIDYVASVVEGLRTIKNQKGSNLVLNKHIRYQDKYLTLDVVLEGEDHTPKEIYLITTFQIVEYYHNTLLNILRLYKRAIKIKDIYFVYTHEDILSFLSEGKLNNIGKEFPKTPKEVIKFSVRSLSEYIKIISSCPLIESYRFFYRGHSEENYRCIPSIYREPDLIERENIIFHEAVRECPDDFPNNTSTFDKLVKMQHYSLPTRLLDITENPLVALYFACKTNELRKGKVLLFVEHQSLISYYDSNDVCLLSNLVRQDRYFSPKKSLLIDVKREFGIFDGRSVSKNDLSRVICVLPKKDDARVRNQSGAFYLFGMKKTILDCPDEPIPMIEISIDSSCKCEILKELSQIGIQESFLFPELEKSMEMIRNRYSR